MRAWKKVLSLWPIFLLVVMTFFLLAANFTPGTFLSGWDNLHPEFAPAANLQRAWAAAWQEYQGLGLLAGMAHASELFRQVFLFPFLSWLPVSVLRYFFHGLMLLLGVLGMYAFVQKLLSAVAVKTWHRPIAALAGASFYLLNLGTMQNFFLPYEAFSVFFALFPWLMWSLWRIFQQGRWLDFLLYAVILVLGSSAFYVQTIFIVYVLLVGLICAAFIVVYHTYKPVFRRTLLVLLVTLLCNGFWLLPNFYFTLVGSQNMILAKNNEHATEEIAMRNAQYGDFASLARLQGYWFDYQDFDDAGNSVYLLDAWKTHFQNPWIQILSYLPSILILLSFFWLFFANQLKILQKERWLLLVFFVLVLFILISTNPPTGALYRWCQEHLPLFAQIFRANFTKWVVPGAFIYSVSISIFFAFLFIFLEKKKVIFFGKFILPIVSASLFLLTLLLVALPSFQGNFFYSRLRVKIPQAYFQTFAFFKNVDQNVRIANLPQHSFYGWQWNSWGYRGSGFLWYGIKQPILDRAFDVWSSADENYYWQLQTALDAQDMAAFERVLAKYDVSYLLLDESIVNRNTNKPFDYQAWEEFLASSERIQSVATFDFLKIYQFSEPEQAQTQSFISLWSDLPKVAQQAQYTWQDVAFAKQGDYIQVPVSQATTLYPFASLFSNHSQAEQQYELGEDDQNWYLRSSLDLAPLDSAEWSLQALDLSQQETNFVAQIDWQTQAGLTTFHVQALLPTVRFLDQQVTWRYERELALSSATCLEKGEACHFEINGQDLGPFPSSGQQTVLLRSQLRNALALRQVADGSYFDYLFLDLPPQAFQQIRSLTSDRAEQLTLILPKGETEGLGKNVLSSSQNASPAKNCRVSTGSFFKEIQSESNLYTASNANSCDSFFVDGLAHNQGWLVKTASQHLSGLPFTFAVQVESLGRSPIETYLPKQAALTSAYFFLPPTENFNQGYTFYFASDAYGRVATQNRLNSLQVFYWPYQFTQQLALQKQPAAESAAMTANCHFQVQKKALWWYQLDLTSCPTGTWVKLSQGFDPAWLALSKIDGQWQILPHQSFDNWANAWQLTGEAKTVYLLFWPQLLEYLGLLGLGITMTGMISASLQTAHQKKTK